jgi:uncharacterized protein YfiM (DUF2279 family)
MRGITSGLFLGFLGVLVSVSPTGADSSISPCQTESPRRKSSLAEVSADSWWSRDKRLHLAVSAGMVGLSYHLLHDRWHCEAQESRRLSMSLTALAGLIKEVSDKRKIPPTCSYKDLVADGLGILLGILLFTH